MAKLTDVCDIQYGYAFDSGYFTDNNAYPQLVRIRDVKRGFSETYYNGEYPEEYVLKSGDLLVGMDGEFNIARWKVDGALLNQRVCKIVARPDTDEEYLRFILGKALKTIEDRTSFATVKHLSARELNKLELDMPQYEEQVHRSTVLSKLEDVIEQRRNELDKLDELIKARFVEMFVSKNYPREDLDSLSLGKGEYGAQSASTEYDSSRPRYVRITDINDDGSLNEDYVCSSNVDDDDAYKLEYGDFCFARMGATVGKTYAFKSGNQIFAGYLIRYKLRLNKIIPEYLYEFTRLDEYWNWVLLNQSGAAQPGINAKKYGSLMIPVAPLEEQQKFSEFVKQVDKSKVVALKAL